MADKRVAVALSGGVDSSVAALLLLEVGYEVIGIAMRLWTGEEAIQEAPHCSHRSTQDIYDAEQTCLTLGIPFHVINLENEFKEYVIDYFHQEYTRGRTPNPCVACNQHIKFGFLLERALSLGVDYLATGHYARIKYFNDALHLFKGIDSSKDQSYMLYTLGQDKLGHLLFPLGNYLKAETQCLAQQKGLLSADRPSSQDICFVTNGYGNLLNQNSSITPGEIVNSRGEVLGKHKGTAFYTIGQRRGLGLAAAGPLYVTKIESEANRITAGSEEELYNSSLTTSHVNWVSGEPPPEPTTIAVKIRYRSPEVLATLYSDSGSAMIRFDQPQRAITPGQAAVFYQGNEVLGGGIIEN